MNDNEPLIQIGDVVRIRGGRTNWTVIDVVGDRANLESSSAYTDPPALIADLTVVKPSAGDECSQCDGAGHTHHDDFDASEHQQQCWFCNGTGRGADASPLTPESDQR